MRGMAKLPEHNRPRFNGAAARELRMPERHGGAMGSPLGFNGAAARELRMQAVRRAFGGRVPASMGPQLVSCGCVSRADTRPSAGKLQWGRSS